MRRVLWPLLLLLVVPIAAPSQETVPHHGLSVTAFTGVRVPFTSGRIAVYDAEGNLVAAPRQERSGNPILGLEAALPVGGRFSLVAAGVYSRGGEGSFFLSDSVFGARPDFGVRYHSGMLFGRVGVQAHYEAPRAPDDERARPSTDLTVGAALVRELGSVHPALNAGFQGTLPLGRGLHFVAGLEDYLVFWDQPELANNMLDILQRTQPSESVTASPLYDTSNILTLRLGLSLRR